jgi:DNA-binding NarL/FixJ family response regulator
MQDASKVLQGCRVLMVEDEMLVAMELETLIPEQGCAVVGPAATVERALVLLAQERPDAAILDVNLDGMTAAPVAAALRAAAVPFVLVTGICPIAAAGAGRGAARCKPIGYDQLLQTLARALPPS